MSTVATKPKTQSSKMIQVMGGLGALCALLIVLTYEGTAERIAHLKDEALQEAVIYVLPGAKTTKEFYIDSDHHISSEWTENAVPIFAGYDANNQLIGVAIEASGRGYADIIKVLYGYDPIKQQIIGFYVLESKETPGLGDKIQKDASFLENFTELDVSLGSNGSTNNGVVTVKHGQKKNPWEIDGITGATISSRAIGVMLNASTNEWLAIIQANLPVIQNPER
ncbi:MAG: electron transporter RnfG [Rickettsiales bacterium]|nr:electron transporter RnfG [Rickettsiales bacterium]